MRKNVKISLYRAKKIQEYKGNKKRSAYYVNYVWNKDKKKKKQSLCNLFKK